MLVMQSRILYLKTGANLIPFLLIHKADEVVLQPRCR